MRYLHSLHRWMASGGAWFRSRYSDLPELQAGAPPMISHFCVIAGGLALVLSRRPKHELEVRFLASQELYELLRQQLRRHGRASPNAELMGEAMHEIADLVDPTTRAALRACFDARTKIEARKREDSAASPPLESDMARVTQSPPSTTRAARQDSSQEARTVISMDIFAGRADMLRETVVKARDRAPARR